MAEFCTCESEIVHHICYNCGWDDGLPPRPAPETFWESMHRIPRFISAVSTVEEMKTVSSETSRKNKTLPAFRAESLVLTWLNRKKPKHRHTTASKRHSIQEKRFNKVTKFKHWKKVWIKEILYYNCHYCNDLTHWKKITIDHKIPVANGGGVGLNLLPCCEKCNTLKGCKDYDVFLQEIIKGRYDAD